MIYTAVVMQTGNAGSFINMTLGGKTKGGQQWVVSFKIKLFSLSLYR